jgi:signal transduction histidine kinase
MRLRVVVMRHALDALIVLDFAYSQLEIWLAPVPGNKPALMGAATVASLPLLARRRLPVQSALCVFAGAGVLPIIDQTAASHSSGGFISYLVAIWVAGSLAPRRRSVALLLIGLAIPAWIIGQDRDLRPGEIIPYCLLLFAVWLLASSWRSREEHADELEEQARSAVAQERTRIARELHDVIAHCVSVMTVQAGGARLLLDEEPQSARESLLAVEETGRQTLAEMRRLLGILRRDMAAPGLAPQPGLAELDALLARCRQAGLPVELRVEGARAALAPGIDLAAYRVVQEALTNAIKHAGPARAQVTVRYEPGALALEIADDGRAMSKNGGHGHGLVGMRERVGLYGGDVNAGPRTGGGYAVRVRLPLEPRP